jgi:hypothetical protein
VLIEGWLAMTQTVKLGPQLVKAFILTIIGFTSFYAQVAYAAVPDVGTMLENFSQTVPQFMRLVTATAYVMGMWFIIAGIGKLKQYGEARTQMSSQHDLKGPLILMTVGSCLLYLPTSIQSGLATFWTDSNPYAYITEADDQWSVMYQDAFMIIQLIGTISFIRGLVIFTRLSGHGGHPGEFGRGVTHVIAGILCINLHDFLEAVNGTLGITGLTSSN